MASGGPEPNQAPGKEPPRPGSVRPTSRRLLIAKASAFVGALCTGVYAGFALSFLDAVSASGPRNRVIMAGAAAVVSVLVVTAGLLLERACRIPEDPDETP